MTATLNASNGHAQRKSLTSQLDRLDRILDGLDQALQGAITDAVKEAVSTAVSEAVRSTLTEIVANPHVFALMRGATGRATPTAPSEPTAQPSRQGLLARACGRVCGAWHWSIATLQSGIAGFVARTRRLAQAISDTYRQANAVWALKRPFVIALLIGIVFGIVCYASSPWLAGVVSGISATGAAMGVQLAAFARRLLAAIPKPC